MIPNLENSQLSFSVLTSAQKVKERNCTCSIFKLLQMHEISLHLSTTSHFIIMKRFGRSKILVYSREKKNVVKLWSLFELNKCAYYNIYRSQTKGKLGAIWAR